MRPRKYDRNRQGRYEEFLADVQRRQDQAVRDSIPNCLEQMVELIHEATLILAPPGGDAHPNWQDKSLPRLRDLYCEIKKSTEPEKQLKGLEEMALQLNGWFRRLPWRVEVRRESVNDSYRRDPNASRISKVRVEKVPREKPSA